VELGEEDAKERDADWVDIAGVVEEAARELNGAGVEVDVSLRVDVGVDVADGTMIGVDEASVLMGEASVRAEDDEAVSPEDVATKVGGDETDAGLDEDTSGGVDDD
jgi:hypothetical protein